jgi:hypothetical protein
MTSARTSTTSTSRPRCGRPHDPDPHAMVGLMESIPGRRQKVAMMHGLRMIRGFQWFNTCPLSAQAADGDCPLLGSVGDTQTRAEPNNESAQAIFLTFVQASRWAIDCFQVVPSTTAPLLIHLFPPLAVVVQDELTVTYEDVSLATPTATVALLG